MTTHELEGSAALVTGAGSGIGRATALALAQRGAVCFVSDRDAAGAEATGEEIRAAGGEATALVADVTDPEAVRRAVETAAAAPGGLGIAVNAAGVEGALGHTHEWTEPQWRETLEVNLTGAWQCMRHEIEAMLPRGDGRIVNVASVYGLRGVRGGCGYAAAKHGLVGLTRSAALEFASRGLRINCVCPAPTATPMMQRLAAANPKLADQARRANPAHRLVEAAAVAAAICWLCSPGSESLNGLALPIDDGWTAG